MKAQGFRLNVLKGIIVENVEATSANRGQTLNFQLDGLVFEHRILPLLSGTVVVDRIVLEKPRFELVPSGKASPPPEPSAAEGGGGVPLEVQVKTISIVDGSLSARNPEGVEKTRVEDLDLEMRNVRLEPGRESLSALSADGTLFISKLLFDRLELSAVAGTFQLADAVFAIPELSFSLPDAKFTSSGRVDFNPVPFAYAMNAEGDPMDLNGMVGAEEGFGNATIHLEVQGRGPETKDLRAEGLLALAEGRLPDAEVFRRIDAALGRRALVGSPYQATEASFRVANDQVRLAPFRFEGDEAALGLEGTLILLGPVAFDLAISTPREGLSIEGVGSDVLDVLADDRGWVAVPMNVTGTLEEPRVLPDAKALLSQAGRGLQRKATEAATEALGGLLKKKKKKNE
jgi:hypothetical protein